jgi:hypothetical protein
VNNINAKPTDEFVGSGPDGRQAVLEAFDKQLTKERGLLEDGTTLLFVVVRVTQDQIVPSVYSTSMSTTQLGQALQSHLHCQVGEAASIAAGDLLGRLTTNVLTAAGFPDPDACDHKPEGEVGH